MAHTDTTSCTHSQLIVQILTLEDPLFVSCVWGCFFFHFVHGCLQNSSLWFQTLMLSNKVGFFLFFFKQCLLACMRMRLNGKWYGRKFIRQLTSRQTQLEQSLTAWLPSPHCCHKTLSVCLFCCLCVCVRVCNGNQTHHKISCKTFTHAVSIQHYAQTNTLTCTLTAALSLKAAGGAQMAQLSRWQRTVCVRVCVCACVCV